MVKLELEIAEKWIDIEDDEEEEEIVNAELDEELEALENGTIDYLRGRRSARRICSAGEGTDYSF